MRERIYHHFGDLEEYPAGMWVIVRGEQRKANILAAAALMKDAKAFKDAMMRVLETWENSCQHNLTAENSNRLAWLGRAGCCISCNSPEENTRAAWHTLTKQEQNAANTAAQFVLDAWSDANQDRGLFAGLQDA